MTLQNIVFKTDTVLYRLERLYSANTGQLYEAQLPVEVRGQSYGLDRISQTFEMPALATLIVQKSQLCPS